jgi:hypothetical protein
MNCPCSQAPKDWSKYGLTAAALRRYTLANTDATKTALHQRLGRPKNTKPANVAQVRPRQTGTLSHAQACAGLQVKAVDKAGTKATMANHRHQNSQRLRTSRISA